MHLALEEKLRSPISGCTSQEFRREFRLLLACIKQDRPAIIELLAHPGLDWDYFLQAADFHGLIPAAALVLARHVSNIPERVRVELEKKNSRALDSALVLSGELVRVLRALNTAGIECLPFKGPALAAELWGNFTLRQSMDIDLLLRPEQVEWAVSTLRSCGYSPEPQSGWQKLLRDGVELTMRKPGMPPLELQWGIAPRHFSLDVDIDAMWQRTVASEFGGQPVLRFATEDLLLVLCIHGWKHAWNRLLWCADVARLIQRAQEIDWIALQEHAKSVGLERILFLGLLLANELFDASIPYDMVHSLTVHALAGESMAYMQELSQPSYAGWHRYLLLARERQSDRLKHVSRFLFTPGLGDWDAVQLPQVFAPFYRVVRLARVGQIAAQYAFRRG